MKKLLFLVMLTSMFGTAHATRSRMNSLGQPVDQGSFYLMDNRNFFRNPANVGKMRNFMVVETATDYKDDKGAAIIGNVEGGYFGEFSSDMAFGVYLGKAATVMDIAATYLNTLYAGAGTGGTYLTSASANPLNLFLGGGSDMKWGLNLNYAGTSKDVTNNGEQKYGAYGLAAGIETSGGLQVYANYGSQESEGAVNTAGAIVANSGKLENSGYSAGIIYALNAETTIWGQYYGSNYEIKRTPKVEVDITQFIVGIGRIYELSPTARFNFDLSYNMSEADAKASGKVEKTALPLNIALEADAAEWLILRATVGQNFILGDVTKTVPGTPETKDNSILTGTNVALGGTLHFGKLKIDGNLGGVGGASNSTLLDSSKFFVNAAATYMF